MKSLIEQFPQQVRQMVAQLKKSSFDNQTFGSTKIQNILFLGQGGSGIAGSIWMNLLKNESAISIFTNKTYDIPAWVNANTLVIACSYSGNTEETLHAFNQAQQKNAILTVISSGGELTAIANKNKIPLIVVPDGFPPRTCFGFAFTAIAGILVNFGQLPTTFLAELEQSAKNIQKQQNAIQNLAKQIAKKIDKTIPVIYSGPHHEGTAIRWCQQLNENAKSLCWNSVFPEMNHNELVGWSSTYSEVTVLMLKSAYDHQRVRMRMHICQEVFERYTEEVVIIETPDCNPYEELFYLIWLGDYISVFLAENKQVDPIEIDVINYLKDKMATAE